MKTGNKIVIAYVQSSRDWLTILKDVSAKTSRLELTAHGRDISSLFRVPDIIVLDITAPDAALSNINSTETTVIQIIGDKDFVMEGTSGKIADSLNGDLLLNSILNIYKTKRRNARTVGVLGALGGCGTSEVAISLSYGFSVAGETTLLVENKEQYHALNTRLAIPSSNRLNEPQASDIDGMYILPIEHNRALEQDILSSITFDIGASRIVIDCGTTLTDSEQELLDDLVIVSAPTPYGIQRCLAIGSMNPHAIFALLGDINEISTHAIRELKTRFPGQVHHLPIVEDANLQAWLGRPLKDHSWQKKIDDLIPPKPSIKRLRDKP